jgi:hypothetical protein
MKAGLISHVFMRKKVMGAGRELGKSFFVG